MKDKENILELVRRCLALSKSSNENEAALALSKAQELLFKYNLSLSEIEAADESYQNKSPITKGYDSVASPKNYGQWKIILLHKITQYNFCDIILFSGGKVAIIGQSHNIEVVKELYSWIAEQILKFADEACRDYSGPDRIPTFRRSFLESAARTVGNRLYRQFEESKKETASSTALVVRNESMVKEYIEQEYPDLRKGRTYRGSGSGDGHRAGREAGNKVDLVAKRKLAAGGGRITGGG